MRSLFELTGAKGYIEKLNNLLYTRTLLHTWFILVIDGKETREKKQRPLLLSANEHEKAMSVR